ncbi:MAG: methyltransferase domain-containing protein [Candidatus Poribacteria bacterium]|nr:methyltransferase domain-containing protein [Candidatus Poribacteria bacterium]
MSIGNYLYLTSVPNQEAELVNAESAILTGHAPNACGITISERCVDVTRGAYVKSCMEILFEGEDIPEVCEQIETSGLYAEDFRVSVVKRPRRLAVDTMKIAHLIGGVIEGAVCLARPRVVFLAVITNEKVWLGRLLSESDGWWLVHRKRPYMTSSALPTKLARAIVNLIADPCDRLVDPCCGTGTIVLEAAHMGIRVVGYDINPKMVKATQGNLAHYNLDASVLLGDARQISEPFDALAANLPYGIMLDRTPVQDREILQNLNNVAPKAVFVAIQDLSKPLEDLGYRVRQIVHAPKQNMVRRIYITDTGFTSRSIGE